MKLSQSRNKNKKSSTKCNFYCMSSKIHQMCIITLFEVIKDTNNNTKPNVLLKKSQNFT